MAWGLWCDVCGWGMKDCLGRPTHQPMVHSFPPDLERHALAMALELSRLIAGDGSPWRAENFDAPSRSLVSEWLYHEVISALRGEA